MKRLIFFSFLFTLLSVPATASHITGGEMYYTYRGFNNGMHTYDVTFRLLQRCNSGRQFPNPAIISVFDRANGTRIIDMSVVMSNMTNIAITTPDPCITNPPTVCYDIAEYSFSVSVPASAGGYVISSHVNYRINGISNLASGYNNIGATYTADIPGTNPIGTGMQNNSAVFTGSDLVVVCANNDFSYSFGAVDPDGDELRYYFCEAYASTGGSGGGASPTDPPPFPGVPYGAPFSGSAPLGPNVSVNQATGLVTGIAPPGGIYVVTVCVDEIRNGVVIARQRRDIQIHIAECTIASASLLPEYMLCKNSQTLTISNQSVSPLIMSEDWEFMDDLNNVLYTATGPTATYTFPSIGNYRVRLSINRGQACTDSAVAIIRVWPGFEPDFNSAGICFTRPTMFQDNTTSVHGTPNSWSWDFGEPTSMADFSSSQHPTYTYPAMGPKNVRLIATDTRGCRDTITKTVSIIDKPPITLAFRDTLICVNDALMLQASGSGVFSWTPSVNIVNANSPNPTVSPINTTTYYVELNDSSCRNRDSVKVNVVSFVSLQAMADTTICRGDTIQLRALSNGLQYTWTPAAQFIDPTLQNPFAFTNNASANYQVTATIGGCSASDNIRVTTVPYPVANAGADFTVCYNARAQLSGFTNGSSWTWSPPNLVSNPAILNPFSFPPRTTDYVLSAFDTRGCPKPGRDTVRVTVLPKMRVSAGNDTSVIVNQPLQLHGSGGINYSWIPGTYLSAGDISDPIAVFPSPSTGIRYKLIAYNLAGCRDSAFINIKVFQHTPTVFVPTAFTPNSDGKNDLLRPIAVGIRNIEYFNIYNRWGQMLYSTQVNGEGWNGRVNGVLQSTGTFVWMVKGTDFLGNSFFQKGTTTLIR
jgi:gliding motility-associated-like protein